MNTKNKAQRAYLLRFLPCMAGYMVVLTAVDLWFRNAPPAGPLKYVAAAAPAVPLLGVIWAMGRYLIEERDEYLREQTARSYLWATGLTLAFCTIWGFVENFAEAPHLPLYLVFVLFCCAMGLVQVLRTALNLILTGED